MPRRITNRKQEIKALKVNQWLKEWDKVAFDENYYRNRPEDHFYIFSLSASELRALAGINRRITKDRSLGIVETGIQRRHEPNRSAAIHEYVKYGYPWSELNESQRHSSEYDDLRKPGWLPTSIVINILRKGDTRRGTKILDADLIAVNDIDQTNALIDLPSGFSSSHWRPKGLPPLEVIDGQHRLWAFEQEIQDGTFELPVVAFHGLDISWQAYLFWTINIKPKRINQSLAFDLYPLLRTEDWLEKTDNLKVYRETRAQELVEVLWSHSGSPWHNRINMLGETETGKKMVTQAAWIRALTASYVKTFEGKGTRIGGLFGARLKQTHLALPWSRAQQAAFLILAGQQLQSAVQSCRENWAKQLRKANKGNSEDPAFYGQYSLLSADQGIRGMLSATNDLCFIQSEKLKLDEWVSTESDLDAGAVGKMLSSLRKQPVADFLESIATGLAKFDWRTSSAPGLSEDEVIRKSALRGSGGYKLLRKQLLQVLEKEIGSVGQASKEVLAALGY
jgi:DGQHR domain-containing protein